MDTSKLLTPANDAGKVLEVSVFVWSSLKTSDPPSKSPSGSVKAILRVSVTG
jgi:hypothetical protein